MDVILCNVQLCYKDNKYHNINTESPCSSKVIKRGVYIKLVPFYIRRVRTPVYSGQEFSRNEETVRYYEHSNLIAYYRYCNRKNLST